MVQRLEEGEGRGTLESQSLESFYSLGTASHTHTHRHTERETDIHGDLNRTTAIALTELDTIRNVSIRSTHRL